MSEQVAQPSPMSASQLASSTQPLAGTQPAPVDQSTPGAPLKKSMDERKALLAQQIQMAVARGGRVESQAEAMAVIVYGRPVNHVLHLILTILTAGLWIFVWLLVAATGGEKRWMVSVDEFGNVLNQQVQR